jgi:hypothetical protein
MPLKNSINRAIIGHFRYEKPMQKSLEMRHSWTTGSGGKGGSAGKCPDFV